MHFFSQHQGSLVCPSVKRGLCPSRDGVTRKGGSGVPPRSTHQEGGGWFCKATGISGHRSGRPGEERSRALRTERTTMAPRGPAVLRERPASADARGSPHSPGRVPKCSHLGPGSRRREVSARPAGGWTCAVLGPPLPEHVGIVGAELPEKPGDRAVQAVALAPRTIRGQAWHCPWGHWEAPPVRLTMLEQLP